jgi:hypothetical protein
MDVFDEVWASLSVDGFGRDGMIAEQRSRLARIIMDLSRDKQLAALEIARTASRMMREGQNEGRP